jgi:Zn-dependent protease with chaperone function
MGIATALSLMLIAAGAILTWAVTATVSGLDITAVGVILMIVGIIGLMISLLFLASFAPFARTRVHTEEVVHDL